MNARDFLNSPNIATIWDVISDEELFKFLSKNVQNKISEVFVNNLKGFYENEIGKNNNLIDMNKKYILLMLNFIKKNYPQNPNKITILEEISPTNQKKLITYEEIHSDRKSQFDKDLFARQEEFTNYMTPKVPPVPEFNDKLEDAPITEMEKIIKEMTTQRNYDVEQINRGFKTQTLDDNWLKPQETSIKNEKYQSETINSSQGQLNHNENVKLKYLKIENPGLISNNSESKKNVTWGTNTTKEYDINDNVTNEKLVEQNIFNKLKRIEQEPQQMFNRNDDLQKSIIEINKRMNEMQEEMSKIQLLLKNIEKN